MARNRKILLGAAVLLAAALAGEAALRTFVPELGVDAAAVRTRIEAQESIHHAPYVPDPDLGALLAPDFEARVETPDYSYLLRTDHAGFTNLDPWPEQVNVAVLGNSLITGAGVGYEGQFTTLLQQSMGGAPVLNLGVHGGGTEHQLRLYRKFAAPLHPRVVVALLWLTWDIDNSLKFHDWLDEEPRPDFTEFRFSYGETHAPPKPEETARPAAWRSALRALIDRSHLLRAAHRLSKSLRGMREPVPQVAFQDGTVMYLSARDQNRLGNGWRRPAMPDIREVFFKPLETLKAQVEANGGRFLIVLFPSKEELYAADEFPKLLDAVREARFELAQRHMPVLDLYPVFEQLGTSRAVFFSSDMHPNADGHRIIADVLAQYLR